MKVKGGLKKVVFDLMAKYGNTDDQKIINLAAKRGININDINFSTVNTYITMYKKKKGGIIESS